jgi:hypothetical protein
MPDPVTAAIVGGTQVIGGVIQSNAAKSAAGTQAQAAQQGIAAEERMLASAQEILAPYVEQGLVSMDSLAPYTEVGPDALAKQRAIAGLDGYDAQQQAISNIEQSPLYQAQLRQGEEAMLQNASATGGLRGGNVQAALAQFRPQMLSQEIENQYSRLGGLTALGQTTSQNIAQLGQASAAGQASGALKTGADIANLLGQAGAAKAGGTLGAAQAWGNVLNTPAQVLGLQYGSGVTPGFGNIFG